MALSNPIITDTNGQGLESTTAMDKFLVNSVNIFKIAIYERKQYFATFGPTLVYPTSASNTVVKAEKLDVEFLGIDIFLNMSLSHFLVISVHFHESPCLVHHF